MERQRDYRANLCGIGRGVSFFRYGKPAKALWRGWDWAGNRTVLNGGPGRAQCVSIAVQIHLAQDQGQPLPYDIAAPVEQQVFQSFTAPSTNLGVQTIGVMLLHTPCERTGMTAADWAAWAAMSELIEAGKIRPVQSAGAIVVPSPFMAVKYEIRAVLLARDTPLAPVQLR